MAIKIGANFAYNGKLPNFERDKFKTKAAMKAFAENNIDEGHLSYCEEDGNIYQYKSANSVDATIGKWRIFKTDIVVDAELNGISKNPIQNKAVFTRINRERSYSDVLYQPKYKADYVAKADFNYSELSTDVSISAVDLNGYTMTIDVSGTISKSFYNGTISVVIENVKFDSPEIKNCSIHKNGDLTFKSGGTGFYNCSIDDVTIDDSGAEFYYCGIYNCTFDAIPIIQMSEIISPTINVSENTNIGMKTVIIDGIVYKNVNVKNNKFVEIGYESDIDNPTIEGNTPSCEAVVNKFANYATKTELNGKANTSELNDYLTKSDASNRYLTITNANATYATKSSLNNEVSQLVEEINLKLDDTVAASTYLRQDDANTTYAKKSDISNVYKFKGTKTTYAELPTTGVVTGDVWNITNADAEHGIKAGDNVAWNGTAWDNLSGVTDLSAYATTTTTDAISADVKKLMDKAFPFTVKVSLDKTLAKKGTSQAVKVTITPKIGDDNTNVDEIMINGAEHHGATPYVYSDTTTATTTYNVRVRKDDRTAQGSATITFVNPSYDGAVAANFTATEANIKTLTETLRSGKGGTRTFNLNNQKVCIAYPKAFGAATAIKDANGFDYLASYTRSELSVNGELYYVYLLTNATTITDMKQTVS